MGKWRLNPPEVNNTRVATVNNTRVATVLPNWQLQMAHNPGSSQPTALLNLQTARGKMDSLIMKTINYVMKWESDGMWKFAIGASRWSEYISTRIFGHGVDAVIWKDSE